MTLFPNSLLYLVVALLEIVGVQEVLEVDYLQDSVPVLALTLESIPGQDRDIFTLTARSLADDANGNDIYPEVRIEQSDLYAYNYPIYMEGLPGPLVANMSSVLRQSARFSTATDFRVEVGADEIELAGASGGGGVILHFMVRPSHIVLAAPDSGIVLVTP
ncbi:MAG: hypothetical protein E4H09_03250 [Spirochaetales bacterium]|nr:MAG: hypothetical protein E4H09_03250 [Spirochaetales bacterium]